MFKLEYNIMMNWYTDLNKSKLTPPSYIFSPVWSVLYSLMLISIIIYLKSHYSIKGIILFLTQLIINLLWPILFFRYKYRCISLINLFILNIFVIFTIIEFNKSSPMASYLLYPYFIWILFALYLNFYICVFN